MPNLRPNTESEAGSGYTVYTVQSDAYSEILIQNPESILNPKFQILDIILKPVFDIKSRIVFRILNPNSHIEPNTKYATISIELETLRSSQSSSERYEKSKEKS